jgi:hypothetical protein
MRWVILLVTGALLIAGGQATLTARPASEDGEVRLYGPDFKVAGLIFTVPSRWMSEPAESPARAGQWRVPALHGLDGQEGQAVVLYFGPGKGVGGSTKENIEAWSATMVDAAGHPVQAKVETHQTGGFKITIVSVFGTYNQPAPLPGIPPALRPDYGLLGAIIEGPQGNVYWRFTGPEPLITADIPLFEKIVDSVKPQETSP